MRDPRSYTDREGDQAERDEARFSTFESEGILTMSAGVVIRFKDREFQLTIASRPRR